MRIVDDDIGAIFPQFNSDTPPDPGAGTSHKHALAFHSLDKWHGITHNEAVVDSWTAARGSAGG